MTMGEAAWADIHWHGRPVRLELQWLDTASADAPCMIFLHEGLGSVSMWRDFPERLCRALGFRGLVYSRPGYGRSTLRAAGEAWAPDFMHRQAHEVLPALREALGPSLPARPWLFGHSDGGSIALLHAARWPDAVAGVVAMAPHILVEPVSVERIAVARQAYEQGDLRARLARHHDDPDSAFYGWNDVWLSPAFRDWQIGDELAALSAPLLAVQGEGDEYGTLEQIHGIARRLPHTRCVVLADCGHSPHRDQPEALIRAVQAFVADATPPE